MDHLILRAYAKINLSLDITGKRKDGYHYIKSIMQSIDIYDKIDVLIKKQYSSNINSFPGGTALDLFVNDNSIPEDSSNLAVKGAAVILEKLCEEYPRASHCGYIIKIDKRLPVAAGIAGGSGNAAVVMLALNKLTGCKFTLEELMTMSVAVGADIPFSLMMNAKKNEHMLEGLEGLGKATTAALVEGIGEKVTPLEDRFYYVIMVNPGISISTKEVYQEMDNISEREKRDKNTLFYNRMEDYTLYKYPEVGELKKKMQKTLNAEYILMSGSGPTIVAYYNNERAALQDYEKIRSCGWLKKNWRVWYTESGGR